MSNISYPQLVKNIADAYRTASKTTEKVKYGELASKISDLSSIQPQGEIEITENGEYDVSGYASAKVNVNVTIPDEYQQVAYVESTGTQYIDTGVSITQNIKVKVKQSFTTLVSDYCFNGAIWSAIASFSWGCPHGEFAHLITGRDGAYWTSTGIQTDTDIHEWEIGNSHQIFDGIEYGSDTIDGTNQRNIYLFAWNGGSPIYAKVRFYSAKIYANGNLIRNFVPCYKKINNEIGLYDAMNGEFYANNGTGIFIKGEDI